VQFGTRDPREKEEAARHPRDARTRPRILLALFESGRPTASLASLQRAFRLSRALDAELHVVRILPEQVHVNPLFPQLNVLDTVRGVEQTLTAMRVTRDWVLGAVGDHLEEGRLRVRRGGFVAEVAAHAAEIGADLIVMPPCEGRFGAMVTELAREAHVPVLVARFARSNEVILAATDLEDTEYPVLREAARLSEHLHAPMVAVYNVSPRSVVIRAAAPPRSTLSSNEEVTETSHRLLDQASESVYLDAETVVARAVSPVDAILREARSRDADLVIVGTHPRSWFDRLVGGSVAAQIVNRAWRSVLVTPLDGERSRAEPLAWA
jgi:nucleotide-binding universal stress UspA family protein